jgi:hypothetical protein
MFYSKSTNGFYTTAIHGVNIPADAVEITNQKYQELMSGQASGQSIKGGSDGKPVLFSASLTPPKPKTKFSAREFLRKLTLQEKIDLKTNEDMQAQLWYDELIAADFVDIEDTDTIAATNYGVQIGIFTEQRKAELLTPA